ncbi:MAG: enoyl-CoA hydratase/isomerase family protein [Burkholderiales bacterium]|nr:enoyl-CoA hydratase/isomerase family protein [Burkholderiales bacterium]
MTLGINYTTGDDGIMIASIDMPGQPVNTMNEAFDSLLSDLVKAVESGKGSLKGVIITSGKETFFAGGDLKRILAIAKGDAKTAFDMVESIKEAFRKLETSGVPLVAAINGSALGGGYELALACHHRIALRNPKTEIGLPEVTLGLLPGAGGVTRLVRMLGLEKALGFLMEGKRVGVGQALDAGLIDAIADTPDAMLAAAKAWIIANEAPTKLWDGKGYQLPGGDPSHPKIMQMLMAAPAVLYQKTRGLLPAPEAILAAATEGAQVDFDTACRIESRAFANLATSSVAKNLISTFFFGINAVNGGASRPQGHEKRRFSKIGVLGAGMMGAGIAYVAAKEGIEVVLKDVSVEKAEAGKDYARKLLDQAVAKGRTTAEKKEAVLSRILATGNAADLAGCELVIEAVFENQGLKAKVTREAEEALPHDVIFGSNTSTLPITRLANASRAPQSFIGIHFFSPVDKMQLVEIIRGDETSEATVAAAFDFVRQIKKTPMVANDVLGFFTSRVFGSYIDEGLEMVREGVDPELIDNVSRLAGMPVGPLTVMDEVSTKLLFDVRQANLQMLDAKGSGWVMKREATAEVVQFLVAGEERLGKAYNGGLYEYSGKEKKVWPKVGERFNSGSATIPYQDIKDRVLFRQVLESFHCLDDGVLASELDANIGSVMGIGFPQHTGGVFQYVDTYGSTEFIQRARELASKYGSRFAPPQVLLNRAEAAKKGGR